VAKNSEFPDNAYETDSILAELVHYRELIRKSRAKLEADKWLVAEYQQAVVENKKRLLIKLQKHYSLFDTQGKY